MSRELMMAIAWSPAVVVGMVALVVLAGFFTPAAHAQPARHRGGVRVRH